MSDTLRDQLLGLGFKPAPTKPAPPKPAPPRHGAKPAANKGGPGRGPSAGAAPGKRNDGRNDRGPRPPQRDTRRPRPAGEIDLGKAYAIRAQREKDERIAAEAARQEEARKRREARARLTEFLQGKTLNAADADIARHFPYGGKIKRVYVTPEQLKALNAGELGVVQMDGRYLLVESAVLDQAEAIFPAAVALRVDPDDAAGGDHYDDPKYQIPDDLVW